MAVQPIGSSNIINPEQDCAASSATSGFCVEITGEGRSGGIIYRETDTGHEYATWWEFAAGNGVLAFIQVHAPEHWDARLPWAAGRRGEVLERIASETLRQKAIGYSYEIDDGFINVIKGGHSGGR